MIQMKTLCRGNSKFPFCANLVRLMLMKDSITNFEYSIKEFRSGLRGTCTALVLLWQVNTEVLRSDEDLNGMYLTLKQSGQPRTMTNHFEVECRLHLHTHSMFRLRYSWKTMTSELKRLDIALHNLKTESILLKNSLRCPSTAPPIV